MSTASPQSVAFLVVAVTLSLYALYRRMLPKPIPGIPYNPEAVKSLLGDAPSMAREPRGFMDWLHIQASRHPGPICQVFPYPFGGKPFVVLTDFRESQDVMLRRKEWDRSDWSIKLLGAVLPLHHINMKTNATWKAHRRLLQDLMLPAFLHGVAAPNLHSSVLHLVELWGAKADLAQGRPFAADKDIYYTALDAVLDFTFGESYPHRAIPPQTGHVRSLGEQAVRDIRDAAGEEGPVEPGHVPPHESIELIMHTPEVIKEGLESPFPRLFWWMHHLKPSEVGLWRKQSSFIRGQIGMAVERLHGEGNSGEDDSWVRSAVDLMVSREKRAAEKESREPVYMSQAMEQEIIGFVIAGHDTSSTTLLWGLKLLSDNRPVQTKLRAALQAAHPEALSERRPPSINEILRAPVPYLDAVVEEVLRCGGTVPFLERQCNTDTELLGRVVPRGTTLIMLNQGASFKRPAHDGVDEAVRSPSSRAAAREHGVRAWFPEGIDEFRPERWLVADKGNADGGVAFDPAAGPTMPFGLGLRGCFGRRLAYLEQRITLTLLIWSFELLACPPKLSSYFPVDGLTHRPRDCYVRLRRTGVVDA